MFGREDDVRQLIERAHNRGLTAVTGCGRQGKTWTLLQVARQLAGEGNLVGYHECMGEPGVMLQAISALYLHWLDKSNFADQFQLLWNNHKSNLIVESGVFILNSIKGFWKDSEFGSFPAEAASLLERAQKELRTGNVFAPITDYHAALKHLNVIASLASKTKLVLILDAWEQAGETRKEFAILKGFLDHNHLWPDLHIFVGVREPHVQNREVRLEAFDCITELAGYPHGKHYSLPLMRLGDPATITEMFNQISRIHPNVGSFDRDQTLKHIDGYPGVLEQVFNSPDLITTSEEFAQKSRDAHSKRWSELEAGIPHLKDHELKVIIRIALLSRLNKNMWDVIKSAVLDTIPEEVWFTLTDRKLLLDPYIPSFGHDQRHEFAREMVAKHHRSIAKHELEFLIDRLATQIQNYSLESIIFNKALAGLKISSVILEIQRSYKILVDAALINSASIPYGSVLPEIDCSKALERNKFFEFIFAIALFNYAVMQAETGKEEYEASGFDEFLARYGKSSMKVLQQIIAFAQVNKGFRLGQLGRIQEAIIVFDDFLTDFSQSTEPIIREQVARVLINKSIWFIELNKLSDALSVCNEVILIFGQSTESVICNRIAQAYVNKGVILGKLGRLDDAVINYGEIISKYGDSTEVTQQEQVAMALYNKGNIHQQLGRLEEAIDAYNEILSKFELLPLDSLNRKDSITDREILAKFGKTSELVVKEMVAMALYKKGKLLLDRNDESGSQLISQSNDLLTQVRKSEKANVMNLFVKALRP